MNAKRLNLYLEGQKKLVSIGWSEEKASILTLGVPHAFANKVTKITQLLGHMDVRPVGALLSSQILHA